MSAAAIGHMARFSVFSRIVAAGLGGYVLASALSALMALVLPMPRDEAALLGMLLGYVWYALAVIWAFHARSATRAWIGMTVPSALLGLACWVLIRAGGNG